MYTMRPVLEYILHEILNNRENDCEEKLLEYLRDQSLLNAVERYPHMETIKTECNGEEMYGALIYETSDYTLIRQYIPYTKGCSQQFSSEELVNSLNSHELWSLDTLRNTRVSGDELTDDGSPVNVSYQENLSPSRDFILFGVEDSKSHVRDTFLLQFREDDWQDYEYIILNYDENEISDYIHNGTSHIFNVEESFKIKDKLYEEGMDAWLNKKYMGFNTDRATYNVTVLGHYNLGELFHDLPIVYTLINEYICSVPFTPPNATTSQGEYAGEKKEEEVEETVPIDEDYDYVEELVIPNRDKDGRKYKLIIYIE